MARMLASENDEVGDLVWGFLMELLYIGGEPLYFPDVHQ